MGLLNNMINIIGKGVAKGVSEVVEKAVKEAVKPAAAKFAEKQADLINEATKNVEAATESMKDAGTSLDEAGKAIDEAAAQTDAAQLKMGLEFLRENARRAAEEISKLEEEESLTDEELLAKWDELLPDFPKWNCGGNHYSFEKLDLGDDGEGYSFSLDAASASWIAYKAMLVADGFKMKYRSDTAFWYKEVDGRYPAVHLFHIDYDSCEIILYFYYETEAEIEAAKKL